MMESFWRLVTTWSLRARPQRGPGPQPLHKYRSEEVGKKIKQIRQTIKNVNAGAFGPTTLLSAAITVIASPALGGSVPARVFRDVRTAGKEKKGWGGFK